MREEKVTDFPNAASRLVPGRYLLDDDDDG